MKRGRISKVEKETYAADSQMAIKNGVFDQLNDDDLYSGIEKDDPESVIKAYKQASEFKKKQSSGYYDKHLKKYESCRNANKIYKPLTKTKNNSTKNTPPTIPKKTIPIEQEKIISIYTEKLEFYGDPSFIEETKQNEIYNNLLVFKSSIIGTECNDGFDCLKNLGWDTYYTEKSGTDMTVFYITKDDRESMIRCYHLRYYGLSVSRTFNNSTREEIGYGRALILAADNDSASDGDTISNSIYDILLFINNQHIDHFCCIKKNIKLTN